MIAVREWGSKKTNIADRNRYSNFVLNNYYCPKCHSFQYPTNKDFNGTITKCETCGQLIDYKKYVRTKNE